MYLKKLLLPILFLFFSQFSIAQNQVLTEEEETNAAIVKVQEMMKDPSFHQKAAAESKSAASVQQQVKALSGNAAQEQEIYNLASDVLGQMKGKSIPEIEKALQEAQTNPEKFAQGWTPEQQAKLKDLANRLPAAQKFKTKP